MSNSITITLPLDDPNALLDAATFVDSLAQTARKRAGTIDHESEVRTTGAKIEDVPEIEAPEVAPPPPSANILNAADLDAEGLPWDHRIDSESKKKLAKTNTWKKKRGVSPELVAEVQAELRAAMAAGTQTATAEAAFAETEEEVAPPPPPTAEEEVAPPPPAAAETSAVLPNTFPELMARITKEKIPQTEVLAAITNPLVGLQSLALLASRTDLVPVVAALLFPEG